MKYTRFLIPTLCLCLLCGCGNNIAEVTPTPTAEVTKQERRNSIPVFYENPEKIYNYTFGELGEVQKTGWTLGKRTNNDMRVEADWYQIAKSSFNDKMKEIDEIKLLFVRVTFVNEPDLPKLGNGENTKIVVDAVIGEGELLEKWKRLVKSAEFTFNRDCRFDSGEDYSEKETFISFYGSKYDSPKYLFDGDGRIYYNKAESISYLRFPDNESGNEYIKLTEEIKTLAKKRYNEAYQRASVYPYLTD